MSDLAVSLFDRIEALLVAAAKGDAAARATLVTEASIQIAAAREKLASLGSISIAQERELARLESLT